MSPPADQPDAVAVMMLSDSASRGLGIEVLGYGAGWASTRMLVREDMVNGHGIAHGGFVFAVADTAFACACNSWGPVAVAADCDIVFVAPALLGDTLQADAQMRTAYGRAGIYDVTVRSGEAVIAEFRGRSQQIREQQR